MKPTADKKNQNGSGDFVARAKRAMLRASDRAMADYERFGIEPVIEPASAKKKIESDGK